MIRIRNPKFAFTDVPRHWLMKSRIASHIANGANLLFPAGERFFVRSVKHYLDQVDDPQLLADVRAFFGQEGRHAAAHERFFETMRAQGLHIDSYLKLYEWAGYEIIERISPPKLRLAATAACEHFTAVLAEAALKGGLLDEAHPEMRELLLWHAVEEIEHRAVAFDILSLVDDSYALRLAGLGVATATLGGFWFMATLWLLAQDSSPGALRRELRVARKRRGVVGRVFAQGIAAYVRPDFHPQKRDLSALTDRARRTVAALYDVQAAASPA